MQLKPGSFCPIIKDECIQLKCAWFTKVEGYNINTGKQVEEWNCAMTFIPMLLIENSGMSRQTGAAVESFRNEMVKSNETTQKIFTNMIGMSGNNNPKLIE
jgi:hypothetical protein